MLKLVLLIILFVNFLPANANDYGFLVNKDTSCKVWWAESTYKIMRDDPVPTKKRKVVIQSARNESEGFQIVLSPEMDINNISVSISDFSNKNGDLVPSVNVTIREVAYVNVTKPSGNQHSAGWYPDPLPLHKKPFNAKAGNNKPLWFTVDVPKDLASGPYSANIKIKSASWETTIPVELHIWNFTLPDIPFMRSGFGLYSNMIKRYHNLETKEELEQVREKYFRDFKHYKISPYGSYPVNYDVTGVLWSGGTFDPHTVYEGKYAYQISGQREARFTDLIEINPDRPYLLKWQAKVLSENQKYTVTVKCYDEEKKPISWSMKWAVYEGSESWRQDTLFIDTEGFITYEDLPDYRPFPANAKYASLQLYSHVPGNNSESGTVWFDDFQFIDLKSEENLLPDGDFEQEIEELDLKLDFSEFDEAARKYLDGMGFTGFRTGFPGLKSGPYIGKKTGWFNGFINGTSEYEKLTGLYFKGFQDHLEANGWLGKEYFYWVDEPKHEEYDFVREGMQTIHKAAPKLTRLITENNPGPEIMDVTEVGCPVLYKVDPEKVKIWSEKGREFWSYLMCWPKEPHVNLFIDSDAINMRMWLWMSYRYNLKGILVWNSNHWNGASAGAMPKGTVQNIWEDPMTYKSGHGTPFGSAPEFGNGDGMFFYPPNRDPNNDKTKYLSGPVPSLRLEILREGLDDYDYMMMLEKHIEEANPNQKGLVSKAKKVLSFGSEVFESDTAYTKDPKILMEYRQQMGKLLEQFNESKSE